MVETRFLLLPKHDYYWNLVVVVVNERDFAWIATANWDQVPKKMMVNCVILFLLCAILYLRYHVEQVVSAVTDWAMDQNDVDADADDDVDLLVVWDSRHLLNRKLLDKQVDEDEASQELRLLAEMPLLNIRQQ